MFSESLPPDDLIGATIACRYRIISRLGAGGMGVAYRAWDKQAGVPVVIKIPKRIVLADARFVERFHREIRLLRSLKHPRIVPIVDVGDHEGLPFVVMRFLPGGSLSNRRLHDDNGKPRPNPPAMLHLWLPGIAEAMDYVHAQGVVHRDVKPANIFFDAFWGAYLGDFGIAKIVEESETFEKEHTLTATHMGIGTQEYMGPEQFTPKALIQGSADQYALAVTVYEMLAGTRPFTGTTAHLIVEVTSHPVPGLDRKTRGLPVSLVEAVHRGLAKNPQERFRTCQEFVTTALRDVAMLADDPDTARLLCPQCSNILKLPTTAAGQKGKCPKCQTQMKVADDLGALWLLDEAKRQQWAAASHGAAVVESEAAEPTQEADEEFIEVFKPVSDTRAIRNKSGNSRKRISTEMILAGITAAGLILGAVVFAFGGGGSSRKRVGKSDAQPLAYEQRVAKAEAALKADSSGRDANDFLARHYCFKERNWERGLPHLAKSGMPDASSLAKEELQLLETSPTNPRQMIVIAQKWWQLSRRSDVNGAVAMSAIGTHAAKIYLKHIGSLQSEEDVRLVNEWLDSDDDFRKRVENKRPLTNLLWLYPSGFTSSGDAERVTGGEGVKLGGRGVHSSIRTNEEFAPPLRVEYDVEAESVRTMDIFPGLFVNPIGARNGVQYLFGDVANRETSVFVFGTYNRVPHEPIEPGRLYEIAIEIDKDRQLAVTRDDTLIYRGRLPERADLRGAVHCSGGFGNVIYRRLSVSTTLRKLPQLPPP